MHESVDRSFSLAAAWARVLTPIRIEEAIRDRRERGQEQIPLSDWLVNAGVLTRFQVEEIQRAQEAMAAAGVPLETPALPTPPPSRLLQETLAGEPTRSGPTDSQHAITRPAGRGKSAPNIGRLGRYDLLEELGRGGMGVVYRALDSELRRVVALKTLLLGDQRNPEMIERLLREARTAATLHHPGIVPIHDMGVIDGVPYFAMTFLSGRTLDRALHDGSLPEIRERAAVLAQVAQAVAHAHEHQVIHRDLKPANILLDENGGAHVMDFGLARRMDDGVRITATGQMIGTPQYMPPEQIDGERERIGPASDVYSLGAVLYEALTGRPPFQGDTMAEIVGRALSRDPTPPRVLDKRIHADLETICLKALEKDPHRRYPSARPLAQDLERFLHGEPIEARPATWRTRIVRRVQRQKLLAAVAALAFLAAAGGSLALWGQVRLQSRVRAALREQASLFLDATLTMRRSGVPIDKARKEFLPRLEALVTEAVRVDPRRAEPLYHLGRMHRALLRFDAAFDAQGHALATDPDFAPSRYERAVLCARLHAERMDRLRERASRELGERLSREGRLVPSAGGELPIPADEELERADPEASRLRQVLLADLAALARRSPEAASPDDGAGALSSARLACARGLARSYETASGASTEESRSLLLHALEIDPTLEEAYEALARIERKEGNWDQATAHYDRGIEADRGYVPFWTGRGELRLLHAHFRTSRGQSAGDLHESATKDFTRALELDADDLGTLVHLGTAEGDRALDHLGRGKDPEPHFRAALAHLDGALDRDPGFADARHHRAGIRTNFARWLMDVGRDPEPEFRLAAEDFEAALRASPDRVETWLWRGTLHTAWGITHESSGRDPEPSFRMAETYFTKAIELDPNSGFAWTSRGGVRANLAKYAFSRGGDPEPVFRDAEADFNRALDLLPNLADVYESLGLLYTTWGTYERQRGGPADARFEAGIAQLGRALDRNSASAPTWYRRAGAYMNWGIVRMERGQDPTAMFQKAERDFDRSLEVNPAYVESWMWRGGLRSNWGAWLMRTDGDPEPLFSGASADYARAVELNPRSGELRRLRSGVLVNLGVHRMGRGEDPTAVFDQAVAELAEAMKLTPDSAEIMMQRGIVRINLAHWRHRRDEDPEEAYRGAHEDFTAAIRINPRSPEGWVNRAETVMGWADWRSDRNLSIQEQVAEAVSDLTEALKLHPEHGEALVKRGILHHAMRRWPEAIRDFEAALRAQPHLAEEVTPRLEEARARQRLREAAAPALELFEASDASVKQGRYTDARRQIEEGLRLAEALRGRLTDEDWKRAVPPRTLRHVRYNLACALSLASAGRDGPGAPTRAIAEDEAEALRDAAFATLMSIAEPGYPERAQVDEDDDFAPLRRDRRWSEFLTRIDPGESRR